MTAPGLLTMNDTSCPYTGLELGMRTALYVRSI